MKHARKTVLVLFSVLFATAICAADDAWQVLFNGKDLTGWRSNVDPESFSVADGAIRVNATTAKSAHLFFVGDLKDGVVRFKDFELELSARSEPNSNSGVFIHTDMTTRNKHLHLAKGYEIQLNSSKRERRKTGSLYAVVDLDTSPVNESKWFRVHIAVRGKRITVKLNDKQVVDYTESANVKRPPNRAGRLLGPDGGAIALQAHDPKSIFYFKDIRIRRLAETSEAGTAKGPAGGAKSVFRKDNLVAWCIVPFDAKKRTPKQRAEMLKRLGISKLAYDWRAEHVPTFEAEILQAKANGVTFFAFWGTHEGAFELFARHGLRPQIWQTLRSPRQPTQARKVAAAAKQLAPLVARTRKLGFKLGLYNHGGWGGEPQNLVAVCKHLRDRGGGADHVGIVYNLHHGHGHIKDFARCLAAMKPYLLCLNLNGMNDSARPKILPLGQGTHDRALLKIIHDSGYAGPVGILDHRADVDAEQALGQNLAGLKKLLGQLGRTQPAKTSR